jgi:Flp pilus assembly pilin Flp
MREGASAIDWREPLEKLVVAVRGKHGQTMAEYGFILAAIALVALASVFLVGTAINGLWEDAKAVF